MVLTLAFVVSLVATPLAMVVARRLHLLDHPGELKIQTEAVPFLGGIGIAAGLASGLVIARPGLLLPLGLSLGLGIVDDTRRVSPSARLAVEAAVGLTIAVALPVRLPGLFGLVAVAVVVVALTNAVNMLDGLDALAGGVGLTSALGFALLLGGPPGAIALALAGGLAGFLVFNRPPAKVYMGDGGAYLLGASLAALLAFAWSEQRPLELSVASLLLVACPMAELASTVLRRRRSGQGLFAGDRSHIYDQLVAHGWGQKRAVGAYVSANLMLVAAAVGAVHLFPVAATLVVAGCAVALLGMIAAVRLVLPVDPTTA